MTTKEAVFSPDLVYRYVLYRDLGEGEGTCLWVMLNSSTASTLINDPTITRVIGFTRAWGYRYVVVVNLFAFKATDPKVMKQAIFPVGEVVNGEELNDKYIMTEAAEADRIMLAYGGGGTYFNRHASVVRMLRAKGYKLYYLQLTQKGLPMHPLYRNQNLKPKLYEVTV